MKVLHENRRKKGYTLAEVLLTVAILMILMAIAVPAIFTIRKNLRQKALDNKAEIIYTAVQNNLTKLRSNGNSELFSADHAKIVGSTPTDAETDKMLYFVTADQKEETSNAASVVLTAETVDAELYQHYWVVEYDPESASVYAVFYSETRDDYSPSAYDPLRYKKNRLKDGARVGYYGGDSIDGSDTSALVPKITVKNEEKLQVIINSKRPDENPLSFEVKLTDTEGHTVTLKYGTDSTGKNLIHEADDLHLANASGLDENNESGSIRGNNYTLTLTLDALEPAGSKPDAASRFYELYGSGNMQMSARNINALTPGSKLTVRVKVKSKSSLVDGLSATAITNSLFGDESTEEQAEILYGRHLQNLDQTSGVTEKINKAVQKSDIHFEKENDLDDGQTDTTSWYSCYEELPFHPITNNNLLTYESMADNENTEGQNPSALLISHLTTEETENAGLFAQTSDNMTISGVYLESARIRGKQNTSQDTYAGALVGYANGDITLNNCQVYLAQKDLNGKTENDLWIDGASVQGGLIGAANGKVTINRCLAATVMGTEDTKLAGGLIGQTRGQAAVYVSYADSYLTGKITGGMIAKTEDSLNINDCYTAGYQKAVEKAGGFLAEAQKTASINNSYSAVTWLQAEGENQEKPTTRYSVMPYELKKGMTDPTSHTYFLNEGTDYSGEKDKNTSVGEKVTYAELSNITAMAQKLNTGTDAKFGSASGSNPYNLKNQGLSSYSYPALTDMPHYGDWQASFEAGSLVYYEAYENGTGTAATKSYHYGFYGGNVTSSLEENAKVAGDGYGVVYSAKEKPQEKFTVLYQELNKNGEAETKSYTFDLSKKDVTSYSVTVEKEEYLIYPLPAEIVNAAPQKDTYYQKIIIRGADATGTDQSDTSDTENVSGSTFYYNPHFAKSVVTTIENAQKAPSVIAIRTARQLYSLSKYYPEYKAPTQKSTFTQELDIDYAAYEWIGYANEKNNITVQTPIGEKEAFTANYDGGYHKVQNISFAGHETKIGFIGENAGTIQNLFLVSDYQSNGKNPYLEYGEEIGRNKTVYMGTLAGVNSGRIQNCAVSGYYTGGKDHTVYVRQNGTLYFGGLAGRNTGTIRNSQSDTPLMNANILYGKAYIGGFVGENASAGKISGSYAIGKTTVEYSKGEKSVIGGFAAKNAGQLNGDYCAVAMTAAGSTETYGFAKSGGSINSNCYYLSGGTFRYLGKMESFDNTNGSGTAKNYNDMKQEQTTPAECSSATGTQEGYPFTAVVRKDEQGNKIHFGNWQLNTDLGSFGVLYWEKEEHGSNDGYHFSYIGYTANAISPGDTMNRVSGSTLCQEHDDGGIITEYGYGYYYADSLAENAPEITATDMQFDAGKVNQTASQKLTERLKGFQVRAYTTAPAIHPDQNNTGYLKMNSTSANAVWTITDKQHGNIQYNFTINPFFANAMQYGSAADGELATQSVNVLEEDGSTTAGTDSLPMPGEDGRQYEIRSAEQLEYINWNSQEENAVTTLDAGNYMRILTAYTYLGQMSGEGTNIDTKKGKYSWIQTHDVDADMTAGGTEVFTQIGSLYDDNRTNSNVPAKVNISYFTGKYDGNTYSVKNVEINSTNAVVGLFGSIIGADVRNIILYSDRKNYIQRSKDGLESWYAIGGLCGLAAVGKDNVAEDARISNCTVSGYIIRDNSTKASYGGVNIGGMFGMSTLDLEKCTAVNSIVLNMNLQKGFSIRVGGLAGSMRGNITYCYTGGEITCTKECVSYVKKNGALLCLGGMNGGIFIKNRGNLVKLLGDIKGVTGWKSDAPNNEKECDTPTTSISNCYTYIKMPSGEETDCIRAIEPIGGNGETNNENEANGHVRIEIQNCYYYKDNIPVMKNTYITKNGKKWNNIDDTATPLTWDQMADASFPAKLNGSEEDGFATVTTRENGHDVKGKYTFPGNHKYLEGENYPFPTILTQNTENGTVNVHYGEWPLNGLYWEESRSGMDIFEDLVTDPGTYNGEAVKTFILKDAEGNVGTDKTWNDFRFLYKLGEDDANVGTDGSNQPEMQENIAEVLNIEYDSEVGGYVATVLAHKTGTEEITAMVDAKTADGETKTYAASFTLTVTADLVAYADSETITLKNGEESDLNLHAVPMNQYNGMDQDITLDTQTADNAESVDTEGQTLELQNASVQTADESEEVTSGSDEADDAGTESSEEMTDGEIQMQTDLGKESGEAVIMPYAETSETADLPEKDLASYVDWHVESDDVEESYITVRTSEDANNIITISCHSDLAEDQVITLTITGTYTYEGVAYTTTSWVVEIYPYETAVPMVDEAGNVYSVDDGSGTVIDGNPSDETVIGDQESESTGEDSSSDTDAADTIIDDSTDGAEDAASPNDTSDVMTENSDEGVILENTPEEVVSEQPTESNAVVGIE